MLFLVQGALFLVVAEAAARWNGFGRRIEYDSSLAVLWQPKPNQHAFNNITNAPVTIDQRGLRIGGQNSDTGIKVLALGDSVTFGYGLSDKETYTARLQSLLEGVEPGRWNVMNGGVNGYNVFLVKQRLVYLLQHGLRPDLLLLGFCFNEYPTWPGEHFNDEEKAAIVRGVGRKNMLRSVALVNYATEVISPRFFYRLRNALMPRGTAHSTAIEADNPRAVAPEQSWLSRYRRRVESLFDEAQRNNIPLMVIVWPDKSGVLGMYRETLLDECARRNVPCLNLNGAVKSRDTSGMFFDAEHPRPDTVRLFMESIGPFFRSNAPKLVKARRGGP